jgi:hypothetical protein
VRWHRISYLRSILSQVREPGGDAFDAAVEREAEERREGLRVEFEGL